MLTDVVRIVADWLADPTHGVAVMFPAVPIDAGITRATVPTLFDESRHEEAARLQGPDTVPAMVVNTMAALNQGPVAVRPFPADGEFEVMIRHIVRTSDTDTGLTALSQGQRALARTMGRLFTASGNETARARNSVQLLSLRAYRAEMYRGNEDSLLTMAHYYTVLVRDTWTAS